MKGEARIVISKALRYLDGYKGKLVRSTTVEEQARVAKVSSKSSVRKFLAQSATHTIKMAAPSTELSVFSNSSTLQPDLNTDLWALTLFTPSDSTSGYSELAVPKTLVTFNSTTEMPAEIIDPSLEERKKIALSLIRMYWDAAPVNDYSKMLHVMVSGRTVLIRTCKLTSTSLECP
jgi:hypothetical protein